MDILIKNMEMPKSCLDNDCNCPCLCSCEVFKKNDLEYNRKEAWEHRLKDCPLVEVEKIKVGEIYPLDRKMYVEASK